MAYITHDDMVARFGDKVLAWADDDDTAVMTAAIESASAEIDGYVASGGYGLPLATVPEILKVHACSIVARRTLRLAVKNGTSTMQNTRTATMVRAVQKLDLGGFV